MLINQSIERLNQMRLQGMANELDNQRNSASTQALSFNERLGLCIDAEFHDREDRRLKRLIKAAKFKVSACTEDIDYQSKRGLDRDVFSNLISCDWIDKSLNVIFSGSTGIGKTWLSCALGHQAAKRGYSVIYKRLSRLLEELEIAYGDGSLIKLRTKLAKVDLIILDDWALSPMTEKGRHHLLELIDDRIGTGSIMITSQLPVEHWHEYIGEATVADAIMDRLVHRAHRINLKGESLRKTKSPMSVIKRRVK